MEALIFSFLACFMLNVWFNTNAFVTYTSYFHIGHLFGVLEYFEYQEEEMKDEDYEGPSTFIEFLAINKRGFFIELITCPTCLGVWLNLVCFLFYFDYKFLFINFWLSMFLFYSITLLARRYHE
jgi:hypothetical protein